MSVGLPRAIVLGDSQAEGLAPHLRVALAPLFHVVNVVWQRGVSTRALYQSGKVEQALEQQPNVVILVLGGNDTVGTHYRNTLIEMVGLAARDGAHVIWIGPAYSEDLDVENRHAAAREAQRAILPALGVLWLDSFAWTRDGHTPDGVHFTRGAYERQAQAIAREIAARRGASIPSSLIVGGAIAGAAAIGLGLFLGRR